MEKYQGIQVLRFVAAGFVVVAHTILNILSKWDGYDEFTVPPFGGVGVYIFFGVSGFIMLSTQYDAFGRAGSAADFLVRRLIRIVPIYAIATSLQYINKFNFSEHYNWLNFLKSLAFIPYLGEGGNYRPVLAQGWTLNFEMFFYVIFAACLLCKRAAGIALCVAIFLLFTACANFDLNDYETLNFYADRVLLYFICGMLAALLHRRFTLRFNAPWLQWSLGVSLIGGALAMALSLGNEAFQTFTMNLAMVFGVVWLAACYRPAMPGKAVLLLGRLGDASYSTYLFHGFVVGALKVLEYRVEPGSYWQLAAVCAIALVAANAVGMLAYRYIELPITGTLRRMTQSPIRRGVDPGPVVSRPTGDSAACRDAVSPAGRSAG